MRHRFCGNVLNSYPIQIAAIAFIGAAGSNSASHNTIVAQQGSGVRIGANGGDGGDLTVTSIHADPLFVDPWHGTYLVYASSSTRDLGGPGVDAGAFGSIADDAPLVVITIEEPTAVATTEGLHVCALIVNPGDYGTRQVGPCSQAPAHGEPITVTVPAAAVPGYSLYGVIVSFPDGAPAYMGPENQGGYWGFWDYLAGPAAFGHAWWHWTSGTRYTTASVAPPGTQTLLSGGRDGLVMYGSPNALPFLRALLPGPEQADPIPQSPEPVGVNSTVTTVITRTSYTLDGVSMALRVTGDPDGGDGLYYLHGDHLGSLSLMKDSGGALVADSMARFLPFGAYRNDGSQPVDGNDLSDRGFTGHYENRELGLTYMQARYYAVELRRFVSADTLVPDPGASIGHNRFAYANQNPINFFDLTGFFAEEAIWDYALDIECGGNSVCADRLIEQWQADREWRKMLRLAETGDRLYGAIAWLSPESWNHVTFIFDGDDDSELVGISAGMRAFRLSDIQRGRGLLKDEHLASGFRHVGFVWEALQKGNSSPFVRPSSITEKGFVPSQIGNPWIAAGNAAIEEIQNEALCFVVPKPFLCGLAVSGGRAYAEASGPNYQQGDGAVMTQFYVFHYRMIVERGTMTVDSNIRITRGSFPHVFWGVYQR